MTTFPAQLAKARQALETAEGQVAPLPADLIEEMRRRFPERMVEAEAKIAEIEATIPDLRAAYEALRDRACWYCLGTGEYGGASGYTRDGIKYCFRCNGSGETK
jgi:transposase